ncbi:hypothetical protein V8E36_009914 [Tilletia maclaganii]
MHASSSRERTLSHAGSELGSVPHSAEVVRRGFFALPGGTKAILAFILSICSYTVQTELAQVVQAKLGYKKPFLSLWLGHSLFTVLLPLHLLFLVRTTQYPLSHWLSLIAKNLDWQLNSHPPTATYDALPTSSNEAGGGGARHEGPIRLPSSAGRQTGLQAQVREMFGFDLLKLLRILLILTVGITIPSLSWYAAVPMTAMADITAVYNTFSVFALVFSVLFLGEEWERRKVISVGLASIGVAIVAYGGAAPEKGKSEYPNPLLGSLLALLGALTMGAYEVIFTLIAKLPDEEAQERIYARPGSRRTRSRTISAPWLARSPTLARYSSDATVVGVGAAATAPPLKKSNKSTDVRVVFDADEGDVGNKGQAQARHTNGMTSEPKDTSSSSSSPPSHERTALVVEDDPTSARTSYEAMGASKSSSPTRAPTSAASLYTGPHSPTLHGPSPLRQTYHVDNPSTSDLFSTTDTAPLPRGITAKPSAGHDDALEGSETESELQDGEEEEIWGGATRLTRSVSRSSAAAAAAHALPTAPWACEDDDANGNGWADNADARARPPLAPSPPSAGNNGFGDPWHVSTAHLRSREASTAGAAAVWIPPPLPFGLHANIMTSGIGIVTFCVLSIGIVIGHWTGLEPFEFPPNLSVVAALAGVGLLGVLFNSTFTLLLGLWGPVLASVSIIGATVLVEIADVVLGHPLRWASVGGCGLIVAGFLVLVGGTEEVVVELPAVAGQGEEEAVVGHRQQQGRADGG